MRRAVQSRAQAQPVEVSASFARAWHKPGPARAAATDRHSREGLRFAHDFSRLPVHGDGPSRSLATAYQGIRGPAVALPHLTALQRSFGRHDLSRVAAHTGVEAAGTSRALGAAAYTLGHHVVFGATPDLGTAAHEAAHVVQQRGPGFRLPGGEGKTGDAYERHADAVRDRVIEGGSAEALLDAVSSPSLRTTPTSPALQRQVADGSRPGKYQWNPSPTSPIHATNLQTVPTHSGGTVESVGGTENLGEIKGEIDGIAARGKQQAKEEGSERGVKKGAFVDTQLAVSIPIEELPGLNVTLDAKGKYVLSSDGEQELELEGAIGVKYKLGSFIDFKGGALASLKLEGENLGAAFVDAIKQVIGTILARAGVKQKLKKFADWDHLSRGEKIELLGASVALSAILPAPLSPLALALPQEIKIAAKGYDDFFKDNPETGFEVTIGISLGAEVDVSEQRKGEISVEERLGLEDKVGKNAPTGFTESAWELPLHFGETEVDWRRATRSTGSESIEIEAEFPGDLGGRRLAEKIIPGLKTLLRSLKKVLGQAKEALQGAVKDFSVVLAEKLSVKSEAKVGLELGLEKEGRAAEWEIETARLKKIHGLKAEAKEEKVGELEIELDAGSFVDVAPQLQSFWQSQ